MRLAKVEDLFTDYPFMQIELVRDLFKKGYQASQATKDDTMLHQAKGIWIRHQLEKQAPIQLVDDMNTINYDLAKDP